MITISKVARTKESSAKEDVERTAYDHGTQRRCIDLSKPGLKHAYKSSTMWDGEGSNEADT